jgi:hypothetical protein
MKLVYNYRSHFGLQKKLELLFLDKMLSGYSTPPITVHNITTPRKWMCPKNNIKSKYNDNLYVQNDKEQHTNKSLENNKKN